MASRLRRAAPAFTIIELIVVIVIIAILAAIAMVAYNGVQHNASDSVTRGELSNATKTLQVYRGENRVYPSNIANTEYAPPLSVPMVLYTNATQTPVYQNLSPSENAQLFANTCNANMPIVISGVTYNTTCVYSGTNLHVKGQSGSNVLINGPIVNQSSIVLTCGAGCTNVQNAIIATFVAQGGTFPITVPSNGSTLPAPTVVNAGSSTRFCLEARSGRYDDIVYHTTSEDNSIVSGACPSDPALHYP